MAQEAGEMMWASAEERELIDLFRAAVNHHLNTGEFSLGTITTSYGRVIVSLFSQGETAPESDAEMSINPKKAFTDLLEIQQLVKETEEIEARNSKLRDEETKLLPQVLDKILKNPSEREALKRVLIPD